MTLTASPAVTPSQLSEGLTSDFSSIQQLSGDERHRFQLASRWYRRGHEALNLADKYLFWWTVLEIYPGEGATNIVRNIKRVLREQVCPQLNAQEVEDKLGIGRIYGELKRIVHEGRAFVALDDKHFRGCLERLQAITTVCIRLLCGLPPGNGLQQFIAEDSVR